MKATTIKLLLLASLATTSTFFSCSENQMDEVNKNVNNPLDVQAKFVLTDVLTRTAFSNVGGDLNTYLSSYVEHEVGTHNQLWDAEHRVSQPQLASTFNNSWENIYQTIRDTHVIIGKCSAGGSEEGNNTTLGIAQVMAAYNLALLTDMFGDVPYYEALEPFKNKTPKLDKQEDLYKQVMKYLDEALINLPKGDSRGTVGTQDLLFMGDKSKWMKFANGLKARYTMRLLAKTTDKNAALQKVIDYVGLSFANADEAASFNIYSAQNLNPLFDYQWSRDGLAASKSIADKLLQRNDPRTVRNFVNPDWEQIDDLAPGTDAYGLLAVNGENQEIQYTYLTSIFVFSQTASTQFLSFHELKFLQVEAMQRLNKPAAAIEAVLKEAITSGIKNSEKSVSAAFSAPALSQYGGLTATTSAITDVQIEDYFTNDVLPLFAANPLKEIAVQKYLAFFGASGETTEMYNDVRRWKSAGENFIELKNPNKFPVRLPYGSSETTTNPNVQAAYGNGQYVYTENVWWAGGTR